MHHSRSRENSSLYYKEKEKERIYELRKTNLSPKKRREMGRQKKTLGSGVSSKKSPVTIMLNVA